MFRNRNKVERTNIYILKSPQSDQLVMEASRAFDLFKKETLNKNKENALQAIIKSIGLYEEAIHSCDVLTDKAYCNRKYASAIIRDVSRPKENRYLIASNHLVKAIAQYEYFLKNYHNNSYQSANKTLVAELQRALVLLGHVSLELLDGKILESTTRKLFKYLEELPNPIFKIEALTYNYHLNLSKNNVNGAKEDITNLLQLSEQYNLPNPTDFRHVAKINLLHISSILNQDEKESYFKKAIQNVFWKAFDMHKAPSTSKSQHAMTCCLIKDFCMLLYIKMIQRLNNIPDTVPNETVYAYIERQVFRVYGKKAYQRPVVLSIIQKAIESIKTAQMITLAYKLFDNTPPHITISKDQFEQLFPDYDTFMLPAESREMQSTPLINQSFFTGTQDEDRNTDLSCPVLF